MRVRFLIYYSTQKIYLFSNERHNIIWSKHFSLPIIIKSIEILIKHQICMCLTMKHVYIQHSKFILKLCWKAIKIFCILCTHRIAVICCTYGHWHCYHTFSCLFVSFHTLLLKEIYFSFPLEPLNFLNFCFSFNLQQAIYSMRENFLPKKVNSRLKSETD